MGNANVIASILIIYSCKLWFFFCKTDWTGFQNSQVDRPILCDVLMSLAFNQEVISMFTNCVTHWQHTSLTSWSWCTLNTNALVIIKVPINRTELSPLKLDIWQRAKYTCHPPSAAWLNIRAIGYRCFSAITMMK